ncbi:MAG: thiamine-phosphate kinase [Mariprofundaceae bacterium]
MSQSEFTLIEELFKKHVSFVHPQTSIANGDDASVHAIAKGYELVVSTDTSVAGVHWPHDFPLDKAADRAVCSALSDLAAMGAEGCWAWVSVMSSSQDDLAALGEGVGAALNRYHIELAGGDTVSAPVNALNITVGGQLPSGTSMCRHASRASDDIWLLGQVGFSSLGLTQWMDGMTNGEFVQSFETITPQLKHGVDLRQLGVRCCIDISDGMLQDIGHIAKASNVGMVFELSNMPNWEALCHQVGEGTAMKAMLAGGEDYALLFTARKDMTGLDSFATRIGTCKEELGVEVQLNGESVSIEASGYDHFV